MTAHHHAPVHTRATHAPWREILRQRWSSRTDRALVLVNQEGALAVQWPRVPLPSVGAVPDKTPTPRLFGSYRWAAHVALGERTTEQTVRLAGDSVSIRVEWWVHDPAQLIHSDTLFGQDPVHRDLKQRLRDLWTRYTDAAQVLGRQQVLQHLTSDRVMDEYGLSYRVVEAQPSGTDEELLLDPTGKVAFPAAWSANRQEEYEFCAQAVRAGPVSLAALWLLRHPDQVQEVLDWSVKHRSLLHEESPRQDELAELLGKLSEEEQQEVVKVLRDRLITLGW